MLNENPNGVSTEQNSEFERLATDSVSTDEDVHSFSNEEKCIAQLLNKIDPVFRKQITNSRQVSGNGQSLRNAQIKIKMFELILQKVRFNGNTMMHICVKNDNLKLMEHLWEIVHKYNLYDSLNIRNYNKETCAHFASAMNKANVLEELLRYGTDVNAVDANGNTALHIAILEKNDDCVETILNSVQKSGAKIDVNLSILNDNGYTALHIAAMTNNVNVVKMLDAKATQMKKPIFDDVEGKHGNNALHIAIISEARNVAEYLVRNNCINPLKVNKSNHTALYLARVAKSMDLVNFLQQYILNPEQYIDDDDDASSKDSFESQEMSKTTIEVRVKFIFKFT